MAVYAIGDVQGCFRELEALLSTVGFSEEDDQLWLTGDLVNRGPDSLAMLRFLRNLGPNAHCVLGNHDLHLLAVACGARRAGRRDTLKELLAAPDADELLHWLRHRPFLHHDKKIGWTMVHAGLPPQWNLKTARACAKKLEKKLRRDDYAGLLANLFGSSPKSWSPSLSGIKRLRFTANCLTRLRYCRLDGRIALKQKGPPGTQSKDLVPWFRVPGRASQDLNILFGHWATLPPLAEPGLLALDRGCVWGGSLLAVRLDSKLEMFEHRCAGYQRPARSKGRCA